MRAQTPAKISRFADVERGSRPVAEYVHCRRGRGLACCAFSHAAPMLVAIFEDERLFDERSCETGRRPANTQHLAGKALIIGDLAGHEASEQFIS